MKPENIIPLPVARRTRHTPLNVRTLPPTVTSAVVTGLRAGAPCSRNSVKGRRLAALVVAAQNVAHRAQCRTLVQDILARANKEGWSARETAKRIGMNHMAWTRLVRGQVKLEAWLPKVRTAVAKLNQPGRDTMHATQPAEVSP